MSAAWRTTVATAAALLAAGCTIVTVPGNARIALHPGILRIEPAAGAGALVYRTRGIGLVPGLSGVTLGARAETVAMLYPPAGCRILLFEPRPADVATLAAILADAGLDARQSCFVGGERQ